MFMSWRWTSVSPRGRILKISRHFALNFLVRKHGRRTTQMARKKNGNEVFVFVVSSALPVIFRDSVHVWHIFKSRSNHVNIFLTWFASDVSSVTIRYESGRFTYLEVLEFSNECFLRPS